jgi:hypothetical protein
MTALPMNAPTLRRWSYRLATVLALTYVAYVVGMKWLRPTSNGPLGELGEFFLVLAAVTALSIGLFADEAERRRSP